MKTIIEQIAQTCEWHKTVNDNYLSQCEQTIFELQNLLPSGSGINNGCKINIELSNRTKVIITFNYHFMDDNGYYTNIREYKLIATVDFYGLKLKIMGKDQQFIKDYLYELFHHELTQTYKTI